MKETRADPTLRAAAWLLFLAAAAATVVAAGSWYALCRDGTFERCLDGRPSFELVFQFVLAVAGLCFATLMLFFVLRRRLLAAAACFAAALAFYIAWAVFLDAATHGWGHLPLIQ
jgi:hypothetical protein